MLGVRTDPLRLCLIGLLIGCLSWKGAWEPHQQPIVYGYYQGDSQSGFAPEQIRYDRFTHISHAFVTADRSGRLELTGNVPSQALTRRAHQAHVKALVAVGGEGSGARLSHMAGNPVTAAKFVQDLVRLVKQNGYDGVDIDWEFPERQDRQRFVAFVRMLRRQLSAWRPDTLLTMAVPACTAHDDTSCRYFDVAHIKADLDLVQIMSYDVHDTWDAAGNRGEHSGHISPLYATSSDPIDGRDYSFGSFVDYWEARGFSPHQLLIGIPCYGHGYAVRNWGETPARTSRYGEIPYSDILGLIHRGWAQKWDPEAHEPYLLKGEIISYDNEKSAHAKGNWARDRGLRGIFFWEISQDFVGGDNLLVKAAREGWSSGATHVH